MSRFIEKVIDEAIADIECRQVAPPEAGPMSAQLDRGEAADPYRANAKPSEPLTDAEAALWDEAFLAVLKNDRFDGHCVGHARNWADWVVEQRRDRMGVR